MNTMKWVGQTLGQYRIEAPLDAGGMGQVFRGVHIYLNRPAAIKVMRSHLAAMEKFRSRFLQEAQAAAALQHPNIVDLYEFGEQDEHLYMVMELVTGGSLRTLLQQQSGQPRPLTLGLDLIRQAAEGLAAAHAKGIIHRDIKPDNLLLNRFHDPEERFQVKITDFGIARLIEGSGLTATGGLPIGTVTYMSPEQCRGEQVDGRSDLYSLGVVLYEVLTGYLPFQIDNFNDGIFKHLNVEPPSPRLIRPDLPPHVEEIILRCLAKKPAERFQSCTALARVLTGLKDEEPITMMTMPLHPQPKPLEQPFQPARTPSTSHDTSQAPTIMSKTIEQPVVPPGVIVPPEVKTLPGHEGQPRVRVLDKQGKNIRTVELSLNGLIVGRQPGCDIVLGDNSISRRHLQISWDGQRVRIKDLGSGNGTFMHDIRLTPQIEQVWLERQLVRLGDYWLRLEGLEQGTTIPGIRQDSPTFSPQISTPSPDEPTFIKGRETIDPTFIKNSEPPSIGGISMQTHGIYQTGTYPGSQRIGLFANSKTLMITPGQPTQVQVTITNLGQIVDWFTLTVEGVPQSWVQLPDEEVQLNPGMQETVGLYINVARVPQNLAQEYQVIIRARSHEKPEEAGATRMRWTVLPFKDDALWLEPRRAGGHGSATYAVTLQNSGNTLAQYKLSGDADEQKTGYQFAPNPVELGPGQESKVHLALHTRRHWLGREKRLPFQVHAHPAGNILPLSAPGEFVNKALIPGWVLPAFFAIVLVAGSILLYTLGIIPPKGNGAVTTHAGSNHSATAPVQNNPTTIANATATSQGTNATATASANATPTPTPPSFSIVVRQATATGGHGGADEIITCNTGEQMLNGGYQTPGTPYANYPESPNTWAVSIANNGPVTAYVLCLQAGFDAQIVTVQKSGTLSANTPLTVTVNCPAGTMLIGGGFLTPLHTPATVSAPTNDLTGWTVSIGLFSYATSGTVTAYARCAGKYLTGITASPMPFTISTDTTNINGVSVGCSGNQFLTGGGFLSQDPTDTYVQIYISGALDNKNWTVKGARNSGSYTSPFQVTAYALCVTPPQRL